MNFQGIEHLKSKLKMIPSGNKFYYYLLEIFIAEEKVSKQINDLVNKNLLVKEYNLDLDGYLEKSIKDRIEQNYELR